jgi:DNA polymerase-1
MKKLLVVDFNSVLYRYCGVFSSLKSSDGVFTGGLYGFVIALCDAINRHGVDYVIVCGDKRPYIREKMYPLYKQGRSHDKKLFKIREESRKLCKKFLAKLGIPLLEKQGFEADDWVALVCQAKKFRKTSIIIYSSDSDLYQLLSDRVSIWRGSKKGFYTIDDFRKDYPAIEPEDYSLLLSISGSHNGIKGIKGYGPVNALRILTDGTFKKVYSSFKGEIDLYHTLIHLPICKVPVKLKCGNISYIRKDMLLFLDRYDIKMTFSMENAFRLLSD